MNGRRGVLMLIAALVVAPAEGVAQAPLRLLYFGNSFTNATCCGSTTSVPTLVSELAVLGGNPRPQTRNASQNGQSLQFHLTNSTNLISAGLPAGFQWDYVVLQDMSTQPTRLGNLALHLSSSLGMYDRVAQHSPDVTAVMYQTWARGPGHSFYTGANPSFPGGPIEMHGELHDGYRLSTAQINDLRGAGSALLAPAGDAWEIAGFPRSFYASDIFHASNRGTLTSALVIYATIYGDPTVTDLPLGGLFTTLGISAADGELIVASVQGTLVPEPAAAGLAALGLVAAAWRRVR